MTFILRILTLLRYCHEKVVLSQSSCDVVGSLLPVVLEGAFHPALDIYFDASQDVHLENLLSTTTNETGSVLLLIRARNHCTVSKSSTLELS